MRRIIAGIVTLCVIALGLGASAAFADPANVGKLKIIEYGSNAPGKDTNANRNYEFVRVQNTTGAALDVEGWILHDSYKTAGGDWGNRYTFHASDLPDGSPFKVGTPARFMIPAGGQVYVYSGSGVDTTPTNNTAAVYRNFKHYLNNGGDSIYVRDGDGTVITWVTYTPYRVRIG